MYMLLYLKLASELCCVVLLSHRTLAETLELLGKQIQCPICLEIYRDPKALACLHAYCRECIHQLLLQQQKDQEVECPQCRSIVPVAGNDPTSLPTVFFINGLIEVCEILKKAESNQIACQNCSSDARAISFCHTCNMFICASCTNAHETMKAFSGHESVLFSEMKEGILSRLPIKKATTSTCQEHEGELLKLYCFECEQLICRDCTLVDHAGHRFKFVRRVADSIIEEVLSSLAHLRDTYTCINTAMERVESSKKKVRNRWEDMANTITHSFKGLHTILDEHEQLLLQQAEEVVGRKVDALDRQQEDLQLALATLESVVGFVEQTAENASDEEVISMKHQMSSRVREVSRKYQDVKLSPNEVANTFIAVPSPTSLAEFCKKSCVGVAEVRNLKSATTKQVSKFKVCTLDTCDQPTPVQQHVSADLKSLVDGSVLHATVVSQTPSTYELSYTPTTRGRHQLTAQVNNTEIGMFQVFVQHPPTWLGTPVRVIEGVTPYYIAVDDKGELFVSEGKEYTVLDAQYQRTLTTGSQLFGGAGPTGIATDGEGNVYVASCDYKVQKLNRLGEVVKSVGKKGKNVGEFNFPYGVRYYNHQVYVCDACNGRVQVFDFNLNFVRSFGTSGDDQGQLKKPRDVDFDAQGNIYVADFEKHQVVVFSEDGQYLHHFGQKGQGKGELSGPYGLCVKEDCVYVTERDNNRVSVFRTSGEFVCSFGKKGSGSGELKYPRGIAIYKPGWVCVCL